MPRPQSMRSCSSGQSREQFDGVDVDGAQGELHGLAATGEVVGAVAFD